MQIHKWYCLSSLSLAVSEIVGKLFCWWNGQVKGSKRTHQSLGSPPLERLVSGLVLSDHSPFHSFHFSDHPHNITEEDKRAPNSNHFPIMQIVTLRKPPLLVPINSVSPAVWMHSFFSPPRPPPPFHTSEKRVYFCCRASVFWHCSEWGIEKAPTHSINLYNPLFEETASFYGKELNYINVWGIKILVWQKAPNTI